MEGRSKFCACNAIRFLRWADKIFLTSHIVSWFCALNATEEAVAAFISAAKMHGHEEYAKKVNLHDHTDKALVSIFAKRLTNIAAQGKLALAVKDDDNLAYRVPNGEVYQYADLHLSAFRTFDKNAQQGVDNHILLGDMPQLKELQKEVGRIKAARIKLLYASDKGFLTELPEPEKLLESETKLSLGLIWAAVDLHQHPEQDAPFIEEILKEMARLNQKGVGL